MAKKEADALAPASHMHPFARQSIKRTLEIRFASCVWTEPRFSGLQPMSESGLTFMRLSHDCSHDNSADNSEVLRDQE